MKEERLEEAKQLFEDAGIKISYDGKSHLGSVIGSRTFIESFVKEKVSKWKKELEQLSDIAIIHSHTQLISHSLTASRVNGYT